MNAEKNKETELTLEQMSKVSGGTEEEKTRQRFCLVCKRTTEFIYNYSKHEKYCTVCGGTGSRQGGVPNAPETRGVLK